MSGLLRQYPPEPYLATATYALAQRVYAKAPEAAADTKLREKKLTRVDLIRDAWQRLDDFLAAYPEDPAADQASFSLANALVGPGTVRPGHRRSASAMRPRYPDSDYLDSYWYIIGYCHYARGAHEQALSMCQKVADAKRKDKTTGRLVESPNKWQAIYILGQIHHSLGAGRGGDPRVHARRGPLCRRPAGDRVLRPQGHPTAGSRHVPAGQAVRGGADLPQHADVQTSQVYRIDLMKFSLLRRDLSDITQHQPGRHPAVPSSDDRAGRRQGLSRPDDAAEAAAEGRRRVPGRLPRREPARQRHGAGLAAGRWRSRRKPNRAACEPRSATRRTDEVRGRRPRQGDRHAATRTSSAARPTCAASSWPTGSRAAAW